MPDKKEECEGIRQYKETAREVKEIRDVLATLNTNSGINKANLENLTDAFKTLAESNRLTHYKLFARTENLKVNMATVQTSFDEHIKSNDKEDSVNKHRASFLVSCIAIGISVVTVIILAKQAGLF
jgi:hypothetical protein